MGVTGLWTVVQPCARPIKIETLNRKRLAVDASIWIYQFLKAVRDKEGNALRNSHIVGFFRRICKLLFIGIKPIFVFDGGAPALKRQTISGRKQRREGRREDAVRTAGKLLALQMQRRAEDEEKKRRDATRRPAQRDEEELPEELVYVEELQMTQQERQQGRKFKKKDQYHLPELDVSMAEMGGPNDPRVMSLEDLEAYARQFDAGEDINVYDFSKIDFNSSFFISLPASDRYNILNAARLRSRLRMGYSKDQLDTMFPDRMAFSKFQIDRVRERNELTQRLMNLNGSGDDAFGTDGIGRVAGEKGREYVLVKNDGVEGGWALGVIGDRDEGERNKPINVDDIGKQSKEEEEYEHELEDDDGFEDVPIEGLNRLPKLATAPKISAEEVATRDILRKRTAQFAARRNIPKPKPFKTPALRPEESDSLFVGQEADEAVKEKGEALVHDDADDEELQRAIAMSLEPNDRTSSPEDDDFEEVFHEKPQNNVTVVQQPSGTRNDPPARSVPFLDDSDEDTIEFVGALAESRQSKRQTRGVDPRKSSKGIGGKPTNVSLKPKSQPSNTCGFDGPLPFEKLDLGSSLLGKKKAKQLEESMEGGFEKENDSTKKKAPVAPPPWFSGDIEKDMKAQKAMDDEDRVKDRRMEEDEEIEFQARPKLRLQDTAEVIDVDAMDETPSGIITVDSSDDDDNNELIPPRPRILDNKLRGGDLADKLRAKPPKGLEIDDVEKAPAHNDHAKTANQQEEEEETYEWEESDHEGSKVDKPVVKNITEPVGGKREPSQDRSLSPEFENVRIPEEASELLSEQLAASDVEADDDGPPPMSGTGDDQVELAHNSDDEVYSDPEDEELMHQLALEAEEHARFAATVNHKTQLENMEDYERELKALRTQQKKDRRDADEVTHVMVSECQQLLKLFGLPYITAPMEAEAQCAELVTLGLVDGIVTDDSDIFLFGGTRVYKNMFNQAKFVECYLTTDLEREFDLTRQKLIRIAHLLGSDYTEGLPGVGPVTALEILSEFPEGLEGFRDWWARVQTGARPTEEDTVSPFRKKFRRNSTKLFLPPAFPDKRVDVAYLNPDVDKDPSQFQWGVPDLDSLRSFLMATIGWTSERTDEVLVPVIKDMNRRGNEGTQANITNFLGAGATVGAGAFAPRKKAVGKSKRMEEALGRMAARARRGKVAPVMDEDENDQSGVLDTEDSVDAEDAAIGAEGSLVEAEAEQSVPRRGARGKAKGTPASRSTRKRKSAAADDGDGSDEEGESDVAKPKKRRVKRKT